MVVVYAQGAHVRVTGPETWMPGWFRGVLPQTLEPVVATSNGQMRQQAQAAFPWEPMSTRFEPVTVLGPGATVRAGLSTDDPIIGFINYDVAAHWPPWGPGTAFARWAARHGIQNVRAAAAKYASHDHPGSFAMERIQAEAGEAFAADLTTALTGLLDQ